MATTSIASPPPRSISQPQDRARLLQSFETALEAAGLSPATIRLYAHGVRRLYAFLERLGLDAPLSGISAEHLREWLNAERRAGASPATIEALHRDGVRTSILSGDRKAAAEAVGEQVGIAPDDVHAQLSPEEKVERVRAYQADGAVAAFVGDGINDAAALVAVSADGGVGIAMGAGSNVAIESADVVVPGDHLYSLVALLDIGRRTLATIKQNLFFSFVYNSLAIPAAALGMLGTSGPVIAAIAMALSDLCVIGNSLRLKASLARDRVREPVP
ncbi:MAG: HAD-IC family P-type ATPase [Chloroflexi bacterium]|nr:HAD-IC family P-type ATPase [Chloroflexota bacterium]